MAIINIGILAHVDAGKTTLTERILYQTGVIATAGSVDKGTTQTDTMELERARGISIHSAVVSFPLNDLKVNLVDTPGHPDFIAEVDRCLRVLDAVVLVISAVEGVQSQSRRLARAVREAGLPVVLFINKIDRAGARHEALLDDIRRKLALRIVPMTKPFGIGERSASVVPCRTDDPGWRDQAINLLAETNQRVIEEFDRTNGQIGSSVLQSAFCDEVAIGNVAPVYFGSAVTGAGVAELLVGIENLLPAAAEDDAAPASGAIFKINREKSGEKVVFARLFGGNLHVRQRVDLRRRDPLGDWAQSDERITAIDRFDCGGRAPVAHAGSGEILVLHGLRSARIGDWIGCPDPGSAAIASSFAAPPLESVIQPVDPGAITVLRIALEQIAEQDPLISLRQSNNAGEISIRLYGDVQKEVLADTLANDYSICVTFGPSTTICVERLVGTGDHTEIIGQPDNPFYGTVGFHVEPGPVGSGIEYRRELGSLPPAFYRAIEESVHESLTQGLSGWEVTDCIVTLTHAGFWSPLSTAGDFRRLTPLVLLSAVRKAGTDVWEPIECLEIEIPADTFGAVCGALVQAGAMIRNVQPSDGAQRITCEIATAELPHLEHQLPGLTRGEGDWSSRFAGYRPVTGEPTIRRRTGPNPLNRDQYIAEVAMA